MAGTHADVPPPVLVCSTTGTGLQPSILDISAFLTSGYPPVLQIVISATANVIVNAAFQVSGAAVPALVDPTDISGGGFAASNFYDLVPGISYYQINVTANTGTVTVKAGAGPQKEGGFGLPQIVRMTTNATQGL